VTTAGLIRAAVFPMYVVAGSNSFSGGIRIAFSVLAFKFVFAIRLCLSFDGLHFHINPTFAFWIVVMLVVAAGIDVRMNNNGMDM
jgi:hypothetical protein